MAIIDSESAVLDLMVSIYRKVCALLELDLSLSIYGETAQCNVSERTGIVREEIVFRVIALEPLLKVIFRLLTVSERELLKADDVGLLRLYEAEDRIDAFLAGRNARIASMHGKTSHIPCHDLYRTAFCRHFYGLVGIELDISSDEEE